MAASMDKLARTFGRVVRAVLPEVDYLGSYKCRVVKQNEDGTLELQPLRPGMAPLSEVKLSQEVGGVSVTLKPDSQVLLSWEGGDPGSPYAEVLEAASVVEWRLTAETVVFNDGATPVAKEGSGTTGHTHLIQGTAGPYPIVATIQTSTDSIATGAGSQDILVP